MTKNKQSKYIPALRFHLLTPLYDIIIGCTARERLFKQALIKQARIEPGQRVLDLATGTGTLAIWIKQHRPQAKVNAIDGDPDILTIARKKALRADVSLQFDQALSWELPFPAATFDRVLSSMFFHHLSWPDKVRTVHEVYRVLKPGGELHVADWGRPANLLMRTLFLIVQFLDGFGNTRDHVNGRFDHLFAENGFNNVERLSRFNSLYGTIALYCAIKSEN